MIIENTNLASMCSCNMTRPNWTRCPSKFWNAFCSFAADMDLLNRVVCCFQAQQLNPLTGLPYSNRYYELFRKRIALPVWEYREKFFEYLGTHQILVLVGETGSGKTTQVSHCSTPACSKAFKRGYLFSATFNFYLIGARSTSGPKNRAFFFFLFFKGQLQSLAPLSVQPVPRNRLGHDW